MTSPSGSTLQCDMWLWDGMPLNLPKRPPQKKSPPPTADGYHVTTDGGKIGLKFFKPAKRAGKFWAVCNMIIPNFSKTFSYHLSIPNILGAPPQHSTEGGWLVNQVKGQSHKAQLTKRQRKGCKPRKILIHAGGAPKI